MTGLHYGSIGSHGDDIQTQRWLLAHGATVDVRDHDGQTALYKAVIHHQYDSAQVLLTHGADPNARDPHGVTPFTLSISGNRDDILLLLAHGADPGTLDWTKRDTISTMRMISEHLRSRPHHVKTYLTALTHGLVAGGRAAAWAAPILAEIR